MRRFVTPCGHTVTLVEPRSQCDHRVSQSAVWFKTSLCDVGDRGVEPELLVAYFLMQRKTARRLYIGVGAVLAHDLRDRPARHRYTITASAVVVQGKMRIARAMWVAVLAICLEIPDVVAQECGSSSDQKVGLVAAGAATSGQGGFPTLYQPYGSSTVVIGGRTYAIVAWLASSSISLVDVSDPSSPVAVGRATDGEGGFTTLGGPHAVSTFVIGGRTYAIVAASHGFRNRTCHP